MTSTVTSNNSHVSPTSTFGGSPSINSDDSGVIFVVVMGVCGTGKSTLGAALARALHVPFIDGDDLHPPANVAKMARGAPLEDVDRWPWLAAIRRTAVGCVLGGTSPGRGVVVACSALKQSYRAVLRGEGEGEGEGNLKEKGLRTWFVYLKGDREVLMARMEGREGHFMKAGMLASQLDTLESPEGEPGVVTVPVTMSTAEQVREVVEALRPIPTLY